MLDRNLTLTGLAFLSLGSVSAGQELCVSEPQTFSSSQGSWDPALAGDWLFAGGHDDPVTVFERQGGVWIETQVLTGGPGYFGISPATDGQTFAVIEAGFDVREQPDLLHVYVRSGGTWVLEQTIAKPSGTFDSVDVDGDLMVAVASGPGWSLPYEAYFFRRGSGPSPWHLEDVHSIDNGGLNGKPDVAVSGDLVVAGLDNGTGVSGWIYPFSWDGSEWIKEPIVLGGGGFARDICLDGDYFMTASPASAEVHVYARAGNQWILDETLSPYGYQLAMGGGFLLLLGNGVPGVSVLQRIDGAWSTVAVLTKPAGVSSFGSRLACDEGTAVTSTAGPGFASWDLVDPQTRTYCTAGTTAIGCQALLSTTGSPSASSSSGFTVSSPGLQGNTTGLFFLGTQGRQANPWGNGNSLQCVVPPVIRTLLQSSGGTAGQCTGSFSLDVNQWMQANPSKAPGAGTTVQLQCWYRDPLNTSNQTTALSNAVEFTVCD